MTALSIPNSFTPNTDILSAQVNANFAAIVTWSTLISNDNINSGAAIDPAKLDLTKEIGPVLRTTGSACFAAGNTGDTQPRFLADADGKIWNGPGGSTTVDTLWKRESAGVWAARTAADAGYGDVKAANITSSGTFSGSTISASTVSKTVLQQTFTALTDANPVVQLSTAGIKLGPGGGSALDSLLKAGGSAAKVRSAADAIYNDFYAGRLYSFVGNDAEPSAGIYAGTLFFGAGGASVPDTGFARVNTTTVAATAALGVTDNNFECNKPSSTANNNPFACFNAAASGATGAGVIASRSIFVSADSAISNAGSLTLAHSLGYVPIHVEAYLVCQTGELGYTAGDVVVVNQINSGGTTAGANQGCTVTVDSTNLNVRFVNTATCFVLCNKSSGAPTNITAANWKIRFIAW